MQLPGPNTNKRDPDCYPVIQLDEKFGLFEILSVRARACFLDALATGSLSMAVAVAVIALLATLMNVEQNTLLVCGAIAYSEACQHKRRNEPGLRIEFD
jgi:hypothetical protein